MPRMSSEELAGMEDVMPDSQGDVATTDDNIPSSSTIDNLTSDDTQPDSDDTIGQTSNISAEEIDVAPAVNKRPSRPAKRKRGRPAKTTPVILESSQPVETMSSHTPAAKPEPTAPVANKRRTRASTGDLPIAVAKTEAEPSPATKRGRGRSKKAAPAPARKGRAVTKPVARKTYTVVTPENPNEGEDEEADDDDDSEEQEWEVEKIIGDIIDDKGVHHFQVKWKGFPASDNTWEPKLNLTNCKEQMTAYWAKKGRK
ncbi:hypothetical protein F5X68DRAFT_243193 [Plectosphaerella plurivora]|uniref:Chromo domain-containing protein n=1 Tax=Plectosphaerella plurivora TaxID=936078 RepID=A0A9P8V7V5_9PEZI|nr:hypothetical protein F5X68DRAFT_243193 [Plectosphaerella plurivora]